MLVLAVVASREDRGHRPRVEVVEHPSPVGAGVVEDQHLEEEEEGAEQHQVVGEGGHRDLQGEVVVVQMLLGEVAVVHERREVVVGHRQVQVVVVVQRMAVEEEGGRQTRCHWRQ